MAIFSSRSWNFLNFSLVDLLGSSSKRTLKFHTSCRIITTPISPKIYIRLYIRQIERNRPDSWRNLLWSDLAVECHNRELWSMRLHTCHTFRKTSHLYCTVLNYTVFTRCRMENRSESLFCDIMQQISLFCFLSLAF